MRGISVNNSTDMVSLVPYLLGFQPSESLVVVAFHEGRVLFATCLDLPVGAAGRENYRVGIGTLAASMARHGATEAVLVGFGAEDPVATAVTFARDVLARTGVETIEALRVESGRMYSLTCTDLECCPADGVPVNPADSPVTVDATLAGLVARPDRNAIADELRPDEGPDGEAFLAATEIAAGRLLDLLDAVAPVGADRMSGWLDSPDGQMLLRIARNTYDETLTIAKHGRRLDDERAAWVCVLLKMPEMLDYALRLSNGDPWQVRLWTDLVRRGDTQLVATPAALLAVCALRAGDGALAGAAVARALSVEPGNRLARYLHMIVSAGIAPHEIAEILASTESVPHGRSGQGER